MLLLFLESISYLRQKSGKTRGLSLLPEAQTKARAPQERKLSRLVGIYTAVPELAFTFVLKAYTHFSFFVLREPKLISS